VSELSLNQKQWLALWLVPGIGPKRIGALLEHLGTVDQILGSSHAQLTGAGLRSDAAAGVMDAFEAERFHVELDRISAKGVQLITRDDPEYSTLLLEISDPPPLLYYKGSHQFDQSMHLAFVGSRKASNVGKSMTAALIKRIAEVAPETVIVSGLALGIDGAAHQAAIDNGLKTLAVLGNGLGSVYPAQHHQLATEVATHGAVISEFPMGTGPQAQNFPLRNRIVSGLCLGTMVIEAAERSGASITANLALEQGREVFALPGPPNSAFCRGTNRMIQQGRAKLVLEVEDIFNELLPRFVPGPQKEPEPSVPLDLTAEEKQVMSLLELGPLHQDQLCQKLQLPIGQLLGVLTCLQMKELLIGRTGGIFEITPH